MDINELESYRLEDAVKFHDRLNPRLWGSDENLLPEVQERLMAIADDFREFLGITDLEIKDITVSGSNAAYTYTPHSDIDLHLVVDLPKADASDVYRELFDAKKYQYNDQHDFKVGGADVELYVQNANQPHASQGIYSLLNRDWVRVPTKRKPTVDDISVKSKYEDVGHRIDAAIESGDLKRMDDLAAKIREMRQTGLEQTGEFGPENLAFKVLRGNGTLDRLRDARREAKNRLMSLDERKKKKKKKAVKYGFGGYWYPGYNFDTGSDAGGGDGGGGESVAREDAGSTWDGVNPTTNMFLNERTDEDTITDFVAFCVDQLGIKQSPEIKFRKDPAWSQRRKTFGQFNHETNQLEISLAGRHIMDVLRTVAHELTHMRQNEVDKLPPDAGETGSEWENEANAMAGVLMRDYAKDHPELFSNGVTEGIQVPVSQDPRHIQQYHDFLQGKARLGRSLSKAEQSFLINFRTLQQLKQQVAEGRLNHALLAAAVATAATMVQAQEQQPEPPKDPQSVQQIIGIAKALYGISRIRQDGVERELHQEFRNWLRRQAGQTEQPTNLPVPDIKEDASGYIPVNKKQAQDPRYSMAVTVDIKPGEVQRQAAKMGFKTDAAGVPPLLMKKLANLLESVKTDEDCWSGYRQAGMKKKGDRMVPNCVPVEEDEELMEVEMSPSAFRRFLNSPEAEGIRAGFEAELIFRNTQSDAEGGESEPDYDMDEQTGSIDDIIDFFRGGDDGISRATAERLRNELYEQFMDWTRDSFHESFFDQDRFREWCDDNIWPDVDDDYREDARVNLDNEEATDEEVEREALALFHDDVERDWDRSGDWYDQANGELYEEYVNEVDQDDWLRAAGLRYMSDVANEWSLSWPYWTETDSGYGEREWSDIGASLERVTGMPVRVSGGYHGAARREGQYIIEPDTSLDADDKEDFGLEVVSPPMPLPEAIEQLNRIIDWANSDGDAYTNSSTGIHMGVSLPYKGGDVDPIKLVLFMGDKNILETFGRESNHYARSAYDRIQDKIRAMKNAGPKQIEGVMELMKKNLIELADRQLQRGGLGDKYVSVHPQDGYIEFRGPGGDYLSKNDEVDGVLENTMLRLAYAMSIAGRPDLYRKEYAKKLYKVLTGYRGAEISKGPRDTKYQTKIETEGENPFMRLFADYSAGSITAEELKTRWADTVLRMEKGEDEDEDLPMDIAKEYEVYDRDTGEVYQTFTAYNDDEAVLRFRAQYRDQSAQPGRLPVLRRKKAAEKPKAAPSRRAELAKRVTRSTRDVGEQLWTVNLHSRVQRVVARSQAEAIEKAAMLDRSFNSPETRARLADRREIETYRIDQEREQQRALQARAGEPQPAGGEFTGRWLVRDRDGQVVHTISGIGNSQADANRYARSWADQNDLRSSYEVVPEMR